MKPEEYYRQLFEYYDGAKYDYNFESLRPPKDPSFEIEGTAHVILDHAKSLLAGKDVLDIACGVGKWCRALAPVVKNITGVECPDRGRLMVNMFFNRGRLYLIQGINLPSTEDASFGPAALLFANSISFFAADGTRNAADNVR